MYSKAYRSTSGHMSEIIPANSAPGPSTWKGTEKPAVKL